MKLLQCVSCQEKVPFEKELTYECPKCQNNLEVLYDYDAIAKSWSKEDLAKDKSRDMWRYMPLYPVQSKISTPPLGWTPCFQIPDLAAELQLKELWFKDDSYTPSASFKDRASAMALKWAKENGHEIIAAASTGNAGAATALWGSLLGLTTRIFVPHTAPPAKIAQLLAFGADVVLVEGTYDEAFDLCLEASRQFGWYNRNTGYNPLTREGKKSTSFEMCEQMEWQAPDVVVVSVGDGNIISGVWKGFVEFERLGFIEKAPRLLAVQAEGSSAIVQAWKEERDIQAVQASTLADSISVDLPRDGVAALAAVRNSNGWGITVTDQEILDAIPVMAQRTGVFAEPAASASFAGLIRAQKEGLLSPDQRVLVLNTGHGLKDITAVEKAVGEPHRIQPNIEALETLFK